MSTSITVANVPDVLKELEEAFYDIPFENSNFQNQMFVVAAQQTPARAFRAVGLRMFAKIRAIKEASFGIKLQDIDIAENAHKMCLESTSVFDKQRLEIENQKLLESRKWTEKLFNDAIQELNCLYQEFNKLPKFTREGFEAEERVHFQSMLQRHAQGITGAQESLENMNQDVFNLSGLVENPQLLASLMDEAQQLPARITQERELLAKQATAAQ